MKVGLVTITELDNFGNRLQNYALQRTLQELGHTAETIPNYIVYKKRKNPVYKALLMVCGGIKRIFWGDRNILSSLEKQARFEAFDKAFISFSHKYSTIKYIPSDLDEEYDAFVAGSDQIWNSEFLFNFEFNFLRFAQAHKRVSYAASFGTDHVRPEYLERFATYLSGMSHISVREVAGKKIVEELTNKPATVVLDPTMLLDASQWSALERKPKWAPDGNYILTYYLGETQKRESIFQQLSCRNSAYQSYPIIDIFDPNKPEQFSIRPDEFLWLVHHAVLMVTDSFHGTVFSILYGTPFCSSPRMDHCASMQSRLDSLFELLGIEKGPLITDVSGQPSVCHRLEDLRRESVAFLEKALRNVEKANRAKGISTRELSMGHRNGVEQ